MRCRRESRALLDWRRRPDLTRRGIFPSTSFLLFHSWESRSVTLSATSCSLAARLTCPNSAQSERRSRLGSRLLPFAQVSVQSITDPIQCIVQACVQLPSPPILSPYTSAPQPNLERTQTSLFSSTTLSSTLPTTSLTLFSVLPPSNNPPNPNPTTTIPTRVQTPLRSAAVKGTPLPPDRETSCPSGTAREVESPTEPGMTTSSALEPWEGAPPGWVEGEVTVKTAGGARGMGAPMSSGMKVEERSV